MIIEKSIHLKNKDYILGFKVEYNQNKKLVKKDGSYFDLGDLSIMIDYFENKDNVTYIYDNDVSYMNDVIYLYDRFQFLEYVKDISYNDSNFISNMSIIYIDEIKKYINNYHIEINKWNINNCPCPLLYKK